MAGDDHARPLILIVEDDPDLLTMLGRMLSDFADVELAEDGIAALEHIETGLVPDLVITDIMMPGVDGLTLAHKLKDEMRTARIPIIMLTAKDRPADVVTGINAGARSYITKPFKRDELVGKVKKALDL